MGSNGELELAYARFLELGQTLSAAGHYEAAYHAFMGAMHCAEDAGDAARLTEVARQLRQSKQTIDALDPPHRLSTRSSHGGRSIFETGATMAEAIIQRLTARERVEQLRHGG